MIKKIRIKLLTFEMNLLDMIGVFFIGASKICYFKIENLKEAKK